MLHNKCKKILVIIFMGFFLLLESCGVFAGTSLKDYRKDLLNQMRKKTRITYQKEKNIYQTKHFYVYIDKESIKSFHLEEGKKIDDLMLRICYVLEEAYQNVGETFDKFPGGRFSILCHSQGTFQRLYGGEASLIVGLSRLKILLSEDLMGDPLDDFSQGTSRIYYCYARGYLYSIKGTGFYGEDSVNIARYFEEVGKKTSSWAKPLTQEKKNKIMQSIDMKYTFLIKKYPKLFKNKDINKKTMTCKWCKKEVDVIGKRKGQRILCPHCRNPIFVE